MDASRLHLLFGLPALGAVLLALGRPGSWARARNLALGTSLLTLAVTAILAAGFDGTSAGLQWEQRLRWLPALGAEYHVGMDGLGLVAVLLTGLLVPFAIALSGPRPGRPGVYFAWMLLLEAALMGAFTAANFLHWFLFWELSLVPAFFLVHGWGGEAGRGAALPFFAYTFVGSVAMLLAMLAVQSATGTLDLPGLAEMARDGRLSSALARRFGEGGMAVLLSPHVIALGVFLGLAVKLPVVPFHTWLPGTYASAPTPVTLLLTGLLSKLGVYGMLRLFLPLFPAEIRALSDPLLLLAVLTIVAPALTALRETSLKRMLAWSSVNHLGYCLLGVVAAARAGAADPAAGASVAGVVLQLFNHGMIAGMLFGMTALWEARTGTDRFDGWSGLRTPAPGFAGAMGVAVFASLGLPGLSGFIGEFLIFRGAFAVAPWATAVSLLGLMATAVFLVGFYQRVFAGPVRSGNGGFADLRPGEWLALAPVMAVIVVLGWLPGLLLDRLGPWIRGVVSGLGAS